MANYNQLKSSIQSVIKTNGNNEITGALLQQTLLSMIESLGVGYQYMGVATPTTNPGTPDQKVFYIAIESGVYVNFGGVSLNNEVSILKYDTIWSKEKTGIAKEDDFYKPETISGTSKYYINLNNVSVGDIYQTEIKSSNNWTYWVIPCNSGEKFIITTKGNLATAKAYAILDGDNKVLEIRQSSATDFRITIPTNGKTLLVNSRNDSGEYYVNKFVSIITKLDERVTELDERVTELDEKIDENLNTRVNIPLDTVGYVNLSDISIGSIANPVISQPPSVGWRSIIKNVKAGEKYILTTSNNLATAKAYAILDGDNRVLAYRQSAVIDFVLEMPENAAVLIVNTRISTPDRASSVHQIISSTDYIQGEIDKIQEQITPTTRKFLEITKEQKGIISACCGFGHGDPTRYGNDAALVVITDIHGAGRCVSDAGDVCNSIKVFNRTNPVIINTGDMFAGRVKNNGVISSFYDTYIALAQANKVFHTIGQHEVGYDISSDNYGRLPSYCLTHEEVFEKFIEPMKSTWELPDLNTIWYYKDLLYRNSGNDTTTIRLISLYEFNCPLIMNADGDKYKYNRATIWYGKEQLQWLADTLASTQDGTLVVLMTHKAELRTIKYKETAFAQGAVNEDVNQPYMMLDSDPIVDIVNAFITRENFSRTYTLSKQYKPTYTEEDFNDFTISKDFTNCGAIFANEFTGDTHVDRIGRAYNTNMLVATLTSSGEDSIDCDVANDNSVSSSIINIVGYRKASKKIRIGRLGQQYSLVGVRRDIDNFDFV